MFYKTVYELIREYKTRAVLPASGFHSCKHLSLNDIVTIFAIYYVNNNFFNQILPSIVVRSAPFSSNKKSPLRLKRHISEIGISITKDISDLLEKTESPDITSYNKYY